MDKAIEHPKPNIQDELNRLIDAAATCQREYRDELRRKDEDGGEWYWLSAADKLASFIIAHRAIIQIATPGEYAEYLDEQRMMDTDAVRSTTTAHHCECKCGCYHICNDSVCDACSRGNHIIPRTGVYSPERVFDVTPSELSYDERARIAIAPPQEHEQSHPPASITYLEPARRYERMNILQNMLVQYHAQLERETRPDAITALKVAIQCQQNALALEQRGIPATLDGNPIPNWAYRRDDMEDLQ